MKMKAIPPDSTRRLQGLIGSLLDTVIGGAPTTPTPTTRTPTVRTPVPTRVPTPTTRSPTPSNTPAPPTRTPTPTTKEPISQPTTQPTTQPVTEPATQSPEPQSTTSLPTSTPSQSSSPIFLPTSTPLEPVAGIISEESTSQASSSNSESILPETPQTPVPTIQTTNTSTDSFSASANVDRTAKSSSASFDGSTDDWHTETSQLGDGLASSHAVEVPNNSPVNTWMVTAIALGVLILCISLIAWCIRRRKRDSKALLSQSFQQHLIISNQEKVSDDTVNSRLDTSSTGPHTGGPRHEARGYSASFLTAAQGEMWEDDIITAMRIPLEKLTKGELLNNGGYGMVYYGSYHGHPVAIKMLLPESRKTLRHINAFLSEIKMMAALEHPRIVRLVGVAWDSLVDLCCVSEYMEGGDLRSLLNYVEYHEHRPRGFDLEKARIALHVAHALTYLHSLDPLILHRDLKSKNILLSENREAKITDFGVSRETSDRTMTAGVGTSLWMAPEVMMGEKYGSSADIFSFGVVLSELDSHVLPYTAAKETDSGRVIPDTALLQLVSLGLLRIEFSPHAPKALVDLAHDCVDLDPDARPKAGEVLYRLQLIMKMYDNATS